MDGLTTCAGGCVPQCNHLWHKMALFCGKHCAHLETATCQKAQQALAWRLAGTALRDQTGSQVHSCWMPVHLCSHSMVPSLSLPLWACTHSFWSDQAFCSGHALTHCSCRTTSQTSRQAREGGPAADLGPFSPYQRRGQLRQRSASPARTSGLLARRQPRPHAASLSAGLNWTWCAPGLSGLLATAGPGSASGSSHAI